MTPQSTYTSNMEHIQGALLVLDLQLHRQVLRWRATHHGNATPEELLGLHTSSAEVDAILDGLYAARGGGNADALDQAPIATISELLKDAQEFYALSESASLADGLSMQLPLVTERLALNPFERQVVLLTLAAEIDRRYGRLFGYLNDDVTRRSPTVDLALQMFCEDSGQWEEARRSFAPDAALQRYRVIHLRPALDQSRNPMLSREMVLDDAVVSFLLNGIVADAELKGMLGTHRDGLDIQVVDEGYQIAVESLRAYVGGRPTPAPVVLITGPDAELNESAASYLATAHARESELVVLDAAKMSQHDSPQDLVARVLRQVKLSAGILAVQEANLLQGTPKLEGALDNLTDDGRDGPVFLLAKESGSVRVPNGVPPLTLNLAVPGFEARRRIWKASLNGEISDADIAELSERFPLTTGQIDTALARARSHAAAYNEGGTLRRSDLFTSCRAQSGDALAGLAQRIESLHSWDDLVVPSAVKSQLLHLEDWVRYRQVVYDDWGYSSRIMMGRGLVVLFSGSSGTGKTMAAGVLARRLELDLYRVDLSSVVSKYIGETEKNLSQIFEVAETANAVLFFDEADALFGKRSEVKDAHDRYANIEVSYLLQRMETYSGIAILASNFRQNLDQAFTRRLHVAIEFPLPNVGDRERIWQQLLPDNVPQDSDIDLPYLARQFALTGGNIRNCVLTAAFSAASEQNPISMGHLVRAVARELEKTEQPIVRSDFGIYYELTRA
ncbi:MAG: ATP-binding protein [Chloroflexi bacterium]|nr:ATP-binding protein [Chloroflexota bacterium]